MSENFVLESFDVVFITDARRLTKGLTARVNEVVLQALQRMRNEGGTNHVKINENPNFIEWVKDGIECEVMTTSSNGWIAGKVRFCLEFIPDPEPEPEPTLDLEEVVESEENIQLKRLESLLDEIR